MQAPSNRRRRIIPSGLAALSGPTHSSPPPTMKERHPMSPTVIYVIFLLALAVYNRWAEWSEAKNEGKHA